MSAGPLTVDDLHRIAEALDVVQDNPANVKKPVIGRIEVVRHDGQDVIGWFDQAGDDPTDGWYGFYPKGRQD